MKIYGMNYTGKYNLLHNDHGNKPHRVNTKKSTQERENRSLHLNLSHCLNGVKCITHNKKNVTPVLNLPLSLNK